jgi:membrane protease YdiL (CAAX protease family)
MRKAINWKVFFILWIAAVLSTIALLPYALELQSSTLASLELPFPLPVLLVIQTVQNAILFGVMIFFGMLLAKRIGLSAPILDSITQGEFASEKLRSLLPISIVLGIIASVLIIGLDVYVFQPALLNELGDKANALTQSAQPAAWKGFLASFYGGIAEEILLRLLVMSFFAWLGSFISKTSEGKPSNAVFWTANILAAVLFGLAHLPATASILPLTPLVITRAIVLNGVAGVVFGYLYWKRGLESAMISHFSADIVLHVLFAL